MDSLAQTIPFQPLLPAAEDQPGAYRCSSEDGHVSVELLPEKVTLFVQTEGMKAVNFVWHGALMHLFLAHWLPTWNEGPKWLDQAVEHGVAQYFWHGGTRVAVRHSDLGIFLEVE